MIDGNDFFVVSPEEDILACETADVARRALDKDVGMETKETVFCMGGVDGDGGADVLVYDDVYFDAFLRFSLEETV